LEEIIYKKGDVCMNEIVMIDVAKLHSHPKNPRKNVGDVTELAESIKKNGIMQNLTVVPFVSEVTGQACEGEYIIVIGHRRRAGAEAAGLREVPCVIKEMTEAEQLATMLAENIQRSDLTPFEQAEGVQMMLDIGETVSGISEKTGFSESTVRRRMKLLELDREKLRDSEKRGATLADYEKLNQIEDLGERNKVLESIGTNNFNMNLNQAISRQNQEKNKAKIIEVLSGFAEKVESYPTGYAHVRYYNFGSGKVEVPDDADERKYVYREDYYGVTLYGEIEDADEKEDEVQKARREAKERESARIERLKELAKQAYQLRFDFVKNFSPKGSHIGIIERFLWDMVCIEGAGIYQHNIDELCDTTMDKCGSDEEVLAETEKYFEENPVKPMLITAYLLSGDDCNSYIRYWSGEYVQNTAIDKLYEHLERLGYQISDDEKKLQDGTHELFERE
jgi:ParB family chromosome partitioning protein